MVLELYTVSNAAQVIFMNALLSRGFAAKTVDLSTNTVQQITKTLINRA
ncbi:MAG: hypothetical protein WCL18_04900 [bacterium]